MAKQKNNTPKIVSRKHIARLERERRQVMLVRIVAIVMIAFVVILIGYGYVEQNYLRLQKPVAVVNGETITLKRWQERLQLQRISLTNLLQQYQLMQSNFGIDTSQQQQQISSTLQSPDTLGQQMLDTLVDEVLIRQEAAKRGITVSSEEVDKAIQAAYRFYPNGTPTPTITPTTFDFPTLTSEQLTLYPSTATPTPFLTSTPAPTATIDTSITPTTTPTTAPPTPTFVPEAATATATPYTLEGFNTQYQTTLTDFKKYGISEAALRAVYENQILRDKVMKAVTADVPTTEEQVWARHILVDSEVKAKAIENLLKQGVSFAELAKDFSTDTGTASSGGDLGWFGRGTMVPEFENVAFLMTVGQTSPPVKSQYGYHIIQVLGHQDLPLTQSQLDQKKQTAFNDWLTTTKNSADVTTYDIWQQNIPPTPDFLAQQQQ